jgi:hypothetical protein
MTNRCMLSFSACFLPDALHDLCCSFNTHGVDCFHEAKLLRLPVVSLIVNQIVTC